MKKIEKKHPKNQQRYEIDVCGYPITTFMYNEIGFKGVGKNSLPIISMDNFRDTSMDDELHSEMSIGLALCGKYEMSMFTGPIIPEELDNKSENWETMLMKIEEYDPTGIHRENISKLLALAPQPKIASLFRYVQFAMGAHIPWLFHLMIKDNTFKDKGTDTNGYTDISVYFPKLLEYSKTLPFKEVGRIMVFGSYPGAGVTIHRDSNVADNKDHSINFFFDGWRPSFIWDEVKKQKYYLEKGARSYFFNDRDYHGVDPEPTFRYTLRVDGTFTDELCEKLGMEDGHTFKWDYKTS
jgi:hypothetical protein